MFTFLKKQQSTYNKLAIAVGVLSSWLLGFVLGNTLIFDNVYLPSFIHEFFSEEDFFIALYIILVTFWGSFLGAVLAGREHINHALWAGMLGLAGHLAVILVTMVALVYAFGSDHMLSDFLFAVLVSAIVLVIGVPISLMGGWLAKMMRKK